jgi:PTS system nitrogen regulatory IIA component
MSVIPKLLAPENILLDLEVGSKKRVFEQVGLLLENNRHISRSTVYDSLFAREKLGSTGLGSGVAIPHGRIKGLKEAVGAFVRLKTPIPYEAPDGKPVFLLFVLLVPEKATDLHLQILGELAGLFSDPAFRERITQGATPSELHQLLTGNPA